MSFLHARPRRETKRMLFSVRRFTAGDDAREHVLAPFTRIRRLPNGADVWDATCVTEGGHKLTALGFPKQSGACDALMRLWEGAGVWPSGTELTVAHPGNTP